MTNEKTGDTTLSPIERVAWIAIISGIYGVIYVIPESILKLNLCLFKTFTGIDCPLCGMTESVHLAARGKIFASLTTHPLGTALIASIFAFTPFVAAGKIPAAFAQYTLLVFVSGFAAWWILKMFFI